MKRASGQTIPKKESSNNSGNGNSGGRSGGSSSPEIRDDIQQDIPSSKPKADPTRLIADDNEKTVNKDNGQSLIANYKPGSSDTPEDTEQQITEGKVTEDRIAEDQATEDQTTEDTGDDQKSTTENNFADNNPADNSPVDNDSKPDDGANLPSEDNSHGVGWILVICASVGILMFGLGLYLGFRKRKKINKK